MRWLAAALLAAGCMPPTVPVDVGPLRDALAGKLRPETRAIAARLPPSLVKALGAATWDDSLVDDPDFQDGLEIAAIALQDYYGPPPPPPAPAVEQCDCDQALLLIDNAVKADIATLKNPPADPALAAAALQVALEAARTRCEHLPMPDVVGAERGCRACTDTGRCAGIGESLNIKSACCPGLVLNAGHCARPNAGNVSLPCEPGQCLTGDPCNSNNDCVSLLCSGNRCACVPSCGGCANYKECCTRRCDTTRFQCTV